MFEPLIGRNVPLTKDKSSKKKYQDWLENESFSIEQETKISETGKRVRQLQEAQNCVDFFFLNLLSLNEGCSSAKTEVKVTHK